MDRSSSNLGGQHREVLDLVSGLRRSVASCLPDEGAGEPSSSSQRTLKTCTACRKVKVVCKGLPGAACPRCQTHDSPCEWPVQRKMGRKVTNPQILKLKEVQHQLARLDRMLQQSSEDKSPLNDTTTLASSTAALPSHVSADSFSSGSRRPDKERALWDTLTDPLRLLSLSNGPVHSQAGAHEATRSSLYTPDADPSLDPVHLGLLTENDFVRLHQIFLANMQLYHFILNPSLHTPSYIRRTSPFLSTVVAMTAAAYDSSSSGLAVPLERHAVYLSTRIVVQGYRSVEIVSGYCIWAAWLPTSTDPDRSLRLINQADSCAQEMRIERLFSPSIRAQYKALLAPDTPLDEALDQARKRTQQVLFSLHLTISIQRGRVQTSLSVPGLDGYACEQLQDPSIMRPDASPNDLLPAYLHAANLGISQFTAGALAQLYSSRTFSLTSAGVLTADQFNSTWRDYFSVWMSRFDKFRHTPCIARLSRIILLLSFSLRLGGQAQAILDECRQAAVQLAQYVVDWFFEDPHVGFAPTVVITDIAYSVQFLLRYADLTGRPEETLDDQTKVLCLRVADVLTMIGSARLAGGSLATTFAQQIYHSVNSPPAGPLQAPVEVDVALDLPSDRCGPLPPTASLPTDDFSSLEGDTFWDELFATVPVQGLLPS